MNPEGGSTSPPAASRRSLDTHLIEIGANFAVCALIALGLTALGFEGGFRVMLTVSLSFGFSFHAVAYLVSLCTPNAALRLLAATSVGLLLGLALSGLLLEANPLAYIARGPVLILGAIFGPLVTLPFLAFGAYRQAQERLNEERLRRLRQEKSLAESRLRLLQAQIEPHFLFNTLSNLRALIEQGDRKALVLLDRLCDLLRSNFEQSDGPEVPLDQELRLVAAYLEIQQIRLGDRFHSTIEVADDLRGLLVPSFLLQPLVENAIKHGAERTEGAAEVTVSACRVRGRVELRVVDNGPGFGNDSAGTGVGLSNVRSRLRSLYDEGEATLALEPSPAGGTISVVSLPWRTEPTQRGAE